MAATPIKIVVCPQSGGLMLTRMTWKADATSGQSEAWIEWWTGTLYRYSCLVSGDGIGTYNLTIKDIYGQDVLRSKLTSQTVGATPLEDDLTIAVSTVGDRPLIVGGRHLVQFSGVAADNATGWLDIVWEPGFRARLDHAGMTR